MAWPLMCGILAVVSLVMIVALMVSIHNHTATTQQLIETARERDELLDKGVRVWSQMLAVLKRVRQTTPDDGEEDWQDQEPQSGWPKLHGE